MPDRSKAPQVRPFGHLTLPAEEVSVLANGLTLHVLNGGTQDVARLSIIAEGGPSDCANPCIAAFGAELLREGCALAGPESIADAVDYNGAWFDSVASGHYTTLRLSSLPDKMPDLLPIMMSCFADPTFPDGPFDIIRQKGVARQKLNLSRVSFLAAADNRRLICGASHPESHIWSPDEIAAVTRDEIIDFHNRRLDASLVHAYLCGRLSTRLIDNVAAALGSLPANGRKSPLVVTPFRAEAPATSVVNRSGSLQSAVVLSLPAIQREHPDYNALRMTVTALGGYFGSRLMMNIREDKGYTYGISAALLGAKEGGYITISAQCDNRYTEALIDEVRAELRRMADEALSADEMARLRFNVASDLASTLDSPMTMMDYYELIRTVGIPPDYFEARQHTLASVTPETICRLSETWLKPDELRISIAGDLPQS